MKKELVSQVVKGSGNRKQKRGFKGKKELVSQVREKKTGMGQLKEGFINQERAGKPGG